MFITELNLKIPLLFPNSTCEHRMLHHHTHNCTISYFIFFSKQEMCFKAILRHFCLFLAIFHSFFQGLAAFSVDPEPLKNPEFFFKKHAFDAENIQIKTLISFPKLFPDHPLQIFVYFYQGCNDMMQCNPAKFSEKYLLNALDAFANADFAWVRFTANHAIPDAQAQEYANVRNAALLNMAQIYFMLAKQSKGIKKETLLQQAKTTLGPSLLPKSQFLAIAIAVEEKEPNKALSLLKEMEGHVEPSDRYLNKAFLAIAEDLLSRHLSHEATQFLNRVQEDALPLTEALDFWILQSLCLRDLGNYHAAHLALSKAVNSSVASSQRLRAMCLRAVLYEIEGREDLAFKQWEAVKTKGGHWGYLAKLKLRKDYVRGPNPVK